MKKITWKKSPSVYRHGKSFYSVKSPLGTVYTVQQDWTSLLWKVSDSFRHVQFPQFKTANQAKKAVESLISKTGE